MRTVLQTLALVFICLWWVFFLLWQIGTVRFIQNLTVRTSLGAEVMQEATKRAFEYSTRGTSTVSDLFFSPAEVMHLLDVASIYGRLRTLLLVCVFCSLVYLFLEVLTKKFHARAFHRASRILFGIVGVGVIAFLLFGSTFPLFHEAFFPQGNWQFPATSMLITLFPEAFWKTEVLFFIGGIVMFGLLYELIYRYWHE